MYSDPVEQIRAIVCGLPPRLLENRALMALRAFVDDSGSGGDSPFYVLGGYVSTIPDWEKFAAEWDIELRRKPEIEYFKSHEAENLEGQFSLVDRIVKDWPRWTPKTGQ